MLNLLLHRPHNSVPLFLFSFPFLRFYLFLLAVTDERNSASSGRKLKLQSTNLLPNLKIFAENYGKNVAMTYLTTLW